MVAKTVQFAEGQGSILASFDEKKRETVKNVLGMCELLGGLCMLGGLTLFLVKSSVPAAGPYAMPLLFFGLPFLFITPGMDEAKLHFRTRVGSAFWFLLTLCFAVLVFEWSWLVYNIAAGTPLAAGKLDSIGDLILCLSVCTLGVMKAWAGHDFSDLTGKCEWCGNICVCLSAPPMESLLVAKAFGCSYSPWIMFVLKLLLGLGIVLEIAAEVLVQLHKANEEKEETIPEIAPLKSSLKKGQGQTYQSAGCGQCFPACP